MPRRPRIALAGLPLHIIQRGNNRSACFFCDDNHAAYLYWLRRYAARFRVRVHAYVLMTTMSTSSSRRPRPPKPRASCRPWVGATYAP